MPAEEPAPEGQLWAPGVAHDAGRKGGAAERAEEKEPGKRGAYRAEGTHGDPRAEGWEEPVTDFRLLLGVRRNVARVGADPEVRREIVCLSCGTLYRPDTDTDWNHLYCLTCMVEPPWEEE